MIASVNSHCFHQSSATITMIYASKRFQKCKNNRKRLYKKTKIASFKAVDESYDVETYNNDMDDVDAVDEPTEPSVNVIVSDDTAAVSQSLIDDGLMKHLMSTFGGSKSDKVAATTVARIAKLLLWTYSQKHHTILEASMVLPHHI